MPFKPIFYLGYLLLCLYNPVALANTITVESLLADGSSGRCELPDAILAANLDIPSGNCPTGQGDDTIELSALSGTIVLSTPLTPITSNLAIVGSNPNDLSIDANALSSVFSITSAEKISVTLTNIRLTGGYDSTGGGINIQGSNQGLGELGPQVHLENCIIDANSAASKGAGIYISHANVTILRCHISQNQLRNANASGAGIFMSDGAHVIITHTSITMNIAQGALTTDVANGGGLAIIDDGLGDNTLQITDSTISGNQASQHGGGLFFIDTSADQSGNSMISIINTTIVNNMADFNGPTGNDSATGLGAGLYTTGFQLTIGNSIIANNRLSSNSNEDNPSEANCHGTLNSLGHNLIGDITGCDDFIINENSDLMGDNNTPLDPKINTLTNNNNNHLWAHPLLPNSPAIDAGDATLCRDQDQFNSPRPIDGDNNGLATCDIGAIESPVLNTISPGIVGYDAPIYQVNEADNTLEIIFTRTEGSNGPVSIDYYMTENTATALQDFSPITGTISWDDGDNTSQSILMTIVNDDLTEPQESLTLSLTNGTGGVAWLTAPAEILIIDNDTPENDVLKPTDNQISFSSINYSVNESTPTYTIAVLRTGDGLGSTSINYQTTKGDATATVDYQPAQGILQWEAGELGEKTFSIDLIDDAILEREETIHLRLTLITGTDTINIGKALLTIVDNETEPQPVSAGVISFTETNYTMAEDANQITLTLNRDNGNAGAITLTYTIQPLTATSHINYTSETGTITWNDQASDPQNITINILRDIAQESTETFLIKLTSDDNIAFDNNGEAIITILDKAPNPPSSVNQDIDSTQADDSTQSQSLLQQRQGSLGFITLMLLLSTRYLRHQRIKSC